MVALDLIIVGLVVARPAMALDPVMAQDRIAALAADMLDTERTLLRLEPEIDALEARIVTDRAAQDASEAEARALVVALSQLARRSDMAAILWPQAPRNAAHSEILVQAALPQLVDRTRALAAGIRQAEARRALLKDRKVAAEAARAALHAQRSALIGLLEARRAAAPDSGPWAGLAAEAGSLGALVARLALPEAGDGDVALIRPVAGRPVPGPPERRGLTLVTRPGALVVSAADGVVRFAGPFGRYGAILITAHSGGYLTVTAGLERLVVGLGAALSAGDPVGFMPLWPDGDAELYFELRIKGAVINPAPYLPYSSAESEAPTNTGSLEP